MALGLSSSHCQSRISASSPVSGTLDGVDAKERIEILHALPRWVDGLERAKVRHEGQVPVSDHANSPSTARPSASRPDSQCPLYHADAMQNCLFCYHADAMQNCLFCMPHFLAL